MHRKKLWLTACALTMGLTAGAAGTAYAADVTAGELIFAQCEEYINIRSEASEDSEVVAKIYNDGAATVEEVTGDGWYKISSGNAEGYVRAEYFATGEEAEAIAGEVAYHVAVVNAAALNVRATPSEDGEILDVAEESDELEVVDANGEWTTVALGNDVYGYISPDYYEAKTYYATAVTLEEEAAAAKAKADAEAAAQAEAEAAAKAAAAEAAAQPAEEAVYTEEAAATADYTDDTAADTSYEESYTEDTTYTDTADTSYTDSTATEDTTYTDTTDASYADTTYTDTTEDTSYTDSTTTTDTTADTTTDSTTTSDSSLGQQIADYAVQFVGNPYVYGGTSLTNGTDCSGFTQSVMANFGISIPRTAADQAYGGTSISVSDIQAGDLLFYSDGSGISHVALYIGGGQIVHAATESQGIIISNYNYSTPVCAARYW